MGLFGPSEKFSQMLDPEQQYVAAVPADGPVR